MIDAGNVRRLVTAGGLLRPLYNPQCNLDSDKSKSAKLFFIKRHTNEVALDKCFSQFFMQQQQQHQQQMLMQTARQQLHTAATSRPGGLPQIRVVTSTRALGQNQNPLLLLETETEGDLEPKTAQRFGSGTFTMQAKPLTACRENRLFHATETNKKEPKCAGAEPVVAPAAAPKAEYVGRDEMCRAGYGLKDHVKSFAARTRMGRCPSRPNKVNQDSHVALVGFCGLQNLYFFGVMDGHGLFGRQASELVAKQLPGTYLVPLTAL